MEVRAILRGIFLTVLLCALALGFAACGGRKQPSAASLQSSDGSGGLQAADSLDDTLAELNALETPDGVDPALFEELKDALAEALNDPCRAGIYPRRSATGMYDCGHKWPPYSEGIKLASSPPTGNTNRIEDLACSLSDGEYALSWLYRNCGDYDQNGSVGIEDITPLAIHFNEDTAPENEWIDGDCDGRVHISDITPIAMHFGAKVHHYSIQGSHFFSSQFTETAQLEFPESTPNDAQLALEQSLGEEPEYLYWRIVSVDDEGNPGDASNTTEVSAAPPPPVRILSVNPLGGVTGTEVTFSAVISGEPPFEYEWNFGGGATPNESTEASPTVTLGAVDTYDAQLSVENADGGAVKHFTLTVTAEPGEPPEIISVSPTEGDSGTEVTFSAEVTGDGPFTYYWDFGGGASPNQSSGVSDQPSATVTLSRGGTLQEPTVTYPASLTVTNPFGMTTHDFNLNISAWWHLIPKPYEEVRVNSVTPDGKPALMVSINDDMLYCEYDGVAWQEQSVPVGFYRELLYNPVTREPAAAGTVGGTMSGTVVYTWRSGAQWYQEEIEYAGWVAGVDLAFHQDGSPVVCWGILGDPFKLKVAERNASEWVVETLPAENQDPRWPSIVVDRNDYTAIAYDNDEIPDGVWIARRQATGWELTEAAEGRCTSPELAVSPNGALLVALSRTVSVDRYTTIAEEKDEGWILQDVDQVFKSRGLGYFESIGVSFLKTGQPVLGYTVDIAENGDSVYEVHVPWRDSETWNVSVPFPPEGNTSSWVGWLTGVSTDGTVVLTVSERDTSNSYIALLW